MKKKLLAGMLCFTVICGLFSGCGSSTASSTADSTPAIISYLDYADEEDDKLLLTINVTTKNAFFSDALDETKISFDGDLENAENIHVDSVNEEKTSADITLSIPKNDLDVENLGLTSTLTIAADSLIDTDKNTISENLTDSECYTTEPATKSITDKDESISDEDESVTDEDESISDSETSSSNTSKTLDTVIKIAEKEVGYIEKASNKDLDRKTANAGDKNYTKYGRDMHKLYPSVIDFPAPWADCFVDWCFNEAYGTNIAKKLLGGNFDDDVMASANLYRKNKSWHKKPKKGDQIFFTNSAGRINHTGLVYKVDKNNVYTIEGNTASQSEVIKNGGCVRKKEYSLEYNRIAGYGRPDYEKYLKYAD